MKGSKQRTQTDRLEFAPRVVRRHGRIFAKILIAEAMRSETPGNAFFLTGVIEWPDEPDPRTPAKLRYERLEAEIVRDTMDEMEELLAEAFVRVADGVIERERAMDERS